MGERDEHDILDEIQLARGYAGKVGGQQGQITMMVYHIGSAIALALLEVARATRREGGA